ncbi:dTDP-4-dehydrorhamnose 3,5-epimerase family protein [Pontivivens insulae]|uniref:dTDP-4-dehydrorhamnose 3,5-epimerase n=1 Tax=Pontivivens insulae TaxID=1639689 RepID=A0A2R8A7G0_9RHOB|nr:dTDP-4-dehydrorhamnose 3,5-epimerase family protein [Pontivivens insulae]RED18271.1 dTDP-4-dehydrorhamnose 3,5-epimerase [Pontivivens insulae]SPF28169.1 hypothetical protein POI8812_00467 [Pontivivens insulae]
MIHDVVITPLRQIFDERGKVMHMMRDDSPVFRKFGEVYFSCTYPGAVKAWHLHKRMTLNYAVLVGQLKVVLFDGRDDSPTKGVVQELFISPENYQLVTVPPGIWNGFKGIGDKMSIVANCADLAHDPGEIIRKPAFDSSIPYDWALKHR